MTVTVTCLDVDEVCRLSVTTKEQLTLIVEEGIIAPRDENASRWEFEEHQVLMIKKACRIHHDLNLNWHAVALVLQLMDERDGLLDENQRLRQQLSRFMRP